MSIHVLSPAPAAAEQARIPWARLSGVRAGVVLWGGLALADVATMTGLPSYAGLGAVALLVAVASVGMRASIAIVLAAIGWLVVDGFVVHRYGVLGIDGTPDVARLALLAGLAMAGARARR